jgi:hypothetical protein
MALSPAQELALVDAALEQLYQTNTQSYSVADRSKVAIEISQLINRKKELEWAVARQSNGGSVFVAASRPAE